MCTERPELLTHTIEIAVTAWEYEYICCLQLPDDYLRAKIVTAARDYDKGEELRSGKPKGER